ncbi:DUF3775 domain-containing protein [Rhodobacterales bacterium HKCCE2091]|nr:DUF3775 domain-containing protein [Rhodobacterales bacterium HKCCE2091]
MLAITTRKVAQIILLRHEIERAEGEFRGLIEALNEDEQAELVAIMWIGRGSFEPEDLAEAIATARAERTTPTADYLIGTPHVADHLEAGMEALGIDITDEEDDVM